MNPHSRAGEAARSLDAAALAHALSAARSDTLATFAAYQSALGEIPRVPQHGEFNPPLWELGHIGWFQAWWIGRNPDRGRGLNADPDAPRMAAARAHADALYNSSLVPHATRWSLPLPDAHATRADLQGQLAQTLALLADAPGDDTGLYFHRLALFHEDMHHEAALYMAQALDAAIDDARWQAAPLHGGRRALPLHARPWSLGAAVEGFAFDNELGMREEALPATHIDSRVITWGEYLPAVDAGAVPLPRYLRRDGNTWLERRHGRWRALDLALPACHLSLTEAEAWCRWAGRRLPSEAEWECAASTLDGFDWGAVWEWTASRFEPYAGFTPHPYRDYSAPWFGTRQVLRGASFATQPRLHHRRYRNFFVPERNDIFAGFRTCAA